MSYGLEDVIYLVEFASQKKRNVKEIEFEIQKLAHEKYFLDAVNFNKKGHNLRKKYKSFLRRNLYRMLRVQERLRKSKVD